MSAELDCPFALIPAPDEHAHGSVQNLPGGVEECCAGFREITHRTSVHPGEREAQLEIEAP